MKLIENDLWRYSPPQEEAIIHQPSTGTYWYFKPGTISFNENIIEIPKAVGEAFKRTVLKRSKETPDNCCDRFLNKTFFIERKKATPFQSLRHDFYRFCPLCGKKLNHIQEFLDKFKTLLTSME